MKTIKKLSALAFALVLLFTVARADWKPAEGNSARFSELFTLLQRGGKDAEAVERVIREIGEQRGDDGDIARAVYDNWKAITDPAYELYTWHGGETAGELESSGLDFSGKHAFVVLGYALSDGEMREELVGRCDAAAAAARSFPDAILITTGGATGANNPYMHTEAGMMKDYLVQQCGIDEARIFTDTEAMITSDNAVNAFRIMREQGIETYTIVTSNYHQRWALVLFNAIEAVIEKDTGHRIRRVGNYNYPAQENISETTGVLSGLSQLSSLFRGTVRTE